MPFSRIPLSADVNLSALGTEDWAIWGSANGGTSTSLAPNSRKLGASEISSLTNIDPAPSVVLRGLGQFGPPATFVPFYFGWANGTAPMNASHVIGGLQHDGETQHLSTLNHGFGFTVPADTRTRTLRVYVSTNRADGTLTATLSDGSAAQFVDVLPQAVDVRSAVYTISYAAASANQTLTVNWVETADNCSTTFQCDNAAIYAVALEAPKTYVVNTADDHNDGTCDGADCSLREAINAANAAAAPGVAGITFDLPGGGAQQISVLGSALPAITVPISIDGTSEPGVPAGTMGVTLNGDGAGASDGLVLAPGSGGSTIRGLAIRDFNSGGHAGIRVQSTGNQIVGDYIGTGLDGTGGNSNWDGVAVEGNTNAVGGPNAGDRNVISGNTDYGVNVGAHGVVTSTGNVVAGNYVGLASDGSTAVPNGPAGSTGGIVVEGFNNTIGGTTAATRNYVAGNGGDGIDLLDGNIVKGNVIGLAPAGNAVPNHDIGLSVSEPSTGPHASTIGDLTGGGNIISGNTGDGVRLTDLTVNPGTVVAGNHIGTNAAGTTAIANGGDGIRFEDAALVTVDGNTVSGNQQYGIHAFGFDSHDNLIEQNKIGTNDAGTAAVANSAGGVWLDESAPNTVDANVISGNPGPGIQLDGPYPTSAGNVVIGNLIGTTASGAQALPNATGVVISGAPNTVGGTGPGDGNVISGNTGDGVDLTGGFTTGNAVEGNTIGLNSGGTSALPNGTGVVIETGANTNTVGGTAAGAGNVISGNTGPGVLIDGAGNGGNAVLGNLIGTNPGQTAAIGNGVGVRINASSNNTIGQAAGNQPNVIAGSAGAGVLIEGTTSVTNLVEGNSIGTDGTTGTLNLGNAGDGVRVLAPSHDNIVRRNTIRRSGGAGIAIPNPSLHTTITANSIDLNAGLGIDVGSVGVTPNGTAGFQSFPTITNATATATFTAIDGSLSAAPNASFSVDLYDSPTCDGSGNGEGRLYLGTTTATTDGTGSGIFSAHVPVVPAGDAVTATAQSPVHDTSEFSACFAVTSGGPVGVISIAAAAPSVPAGAPQVKLNAIPPALFFNAAGAVGSSPVGSIPVGSIPVGSIPVGSIPVGSIPVNSIGLTATQTLLSSIALSTIPLSPPSSWAGVLAGTTLAGLPLQNVTLAQVLALAATTPAVATRLGSVPVGSINLSRSALGSLTPAAIGLGSTPVGSIPVPPATGEPASDTTLQRWCTWLSGPPINCTSATSLTPTTTMVSVGAAGSTRRLDPGRLDPGRLDPDQLDPGRLDQAGEHPGRLDHDPAGQHPVLARRLDPGRLDPGRLDPGRLDPGRLDPGVVDRPDQFSRRLDPGQLDPRRLDPHRLPLHDRVPDDRDAALQPRRAAAEPDPGAAAAGDSRRVRQHLLRRRDRLDAAVRAAQLHGRAI